MADVRPQARRVPSVLSIGDAIVGGTPGAVLFVDVTGKLGQDPTHLLYDAAGVLHVKSSIKIYGAAETFPGTQHLLLTSGTPSAGIDIAGAGAPKLSLGGSCKFIFPGSDGDIALGNNSNRWQQVCAGAFNIFVAQGDAEPAVQLTDTNGLVFGPGGTALGDIGINRGGVGITDFLFGTHPQKIRLSGDGTKYLAVGNDGTDGVIDVSVGSLKLGGTAAHISILSPMIGIDGLDTAPTYGFGGTDGMYSAGAGDIHWAISGAAKLALQSNFLVPVPTSAVDLGIASLRWRNLFTDSITHGGGGTPTLGVFGHAAVGQQAAAGVVAGYVAHATANAVFDATTFTGNVGATAYTLGDVVAALKNYGFLLN